MSGINNNETKIIKNVATIPLRDSVVYPGIVCPIFVGRKKSLKGLEEALSKDKMLFLVSQKHNDAYIIEESDIGEFGVFAKILQSVKRYDGTMQLLVQSQVRAKKISFSSEMDFFQSNIEILSSVETESEDQEDEETIAMIKNLLVSFKKLSEFDSKINQDLLNEIYLIRNLSKLIYIIASNLNLNSIDAHYLLSEAEVISKANFILLTIEKINKILSYEMEIKNKVQIKLKDFLPNANNEDENYSDFEDNVNLEEGNPGNSDKEEGGEIGANFANKEETEGNKGNDYGKESPTAKKPKTETQIFKEKAENIEFTEEAREKFDEELKKLQLTPSMSADAAVIRNYLQWLIDLPWNHNQTHEFDLKEAEDILNKEHYGLDKVKERIIEYLVVQSRVKKVKGNILCLIGPPGVGKTSLAKSVAKAMGRPFVKISLGGLKDESEIRGHRKTYLGAMPGKIIQALKKAKYSNAMVLLDEIDKMSYDNRGDPASALLEVLDQEQNSNFSDHYMEVEYDLSNVMFFATANSSNFSYPLLDRMDIVDISGYTELEKVHIAKDYLIPGLYEDLGLEKNEYSISDGAILTLIQSYTREAGVRDLKRQCASLMRKSLKKILSKKSVKSVKITSATLNKYLGVKKYEYGELEDKNLIGVVNGLAYTTAGGDILKIEVIKIKEAKEGTGGNIKFTGKLGDVMKESVEMTYNLFKSNAYKWGIEIAEWEKYNLHMHFPEGAVPKDGPSAGIAIYTAIASIIMEKPIRNDIAMTGEVSLRGKVLPIGGLKEKMLGAIRSGIKVILVPKKNKKDEEEISHDILKKLEIRYVERVEDVMKHVFDISSVEKEEPVEKRINC